MTTTPSGLPAPHELSIFRAERGHSRRCIMWCVANGADRTGFRTDDTRKRMNALGRLAVPSLKATDRPEGCGLGEALRPVPSSRSVVAISGRLPCIYLKQPPGARFLCPLGAAAVGQVLPFRIGVAAAHGGGPTLIIEGDGSLLMNIRSSTRQRAPAAHPFCW